MSHISEGLVHAHIDGALGPGDREWASAETHLAHCGDCQRRLVEARGLREAAAEILADAGAVSAERPAFDELVAEASRRRTRAVVSPTKTAGRAGSGTRPSWWRSPARLAWAASLALAVGAGWMGRALLVPPERVPAVNQEVRTADEIAATERVLGDNVPQRPSEQAEQPPAALAEQRRAESAPSATEDRFRGAQEAGGRAERAAEPQDADVEHDADVAAEENEKAAAEASADESGTPSRERLDAAAPVVEGQAFAARVAETTRCYAGEVRGAPAQLRLVPDGSARLTWNSAVYVGFWDLRESGDLALRLTDGGAWRDLVLSGGADLGGTLAPGTLAAQVSLAPVSCTAE